MKMLYNQVSAVKPVKLQVGPTVTRYNYDIKQTTITEPDGQTVQAWAFSTWVFKTGELEMVRNGILPQGIQWTDELRSIERGALYDQADKMIMKYTTDVPDEAMRSAWTQYKHSVRSTQEATGYPLSVTYPVPPE